MELEEVKEKILPLFKTNPVEYAGIFGSVARGDARPDSDVDILVKFKGLPTFAGYLKLDNDIRKILNRDIDLLTEGSVNKHLRPFIERDLRIIYGSR
jgi:hypothetical protein